MKKQSSEKSIKSKHLNADLYHHGDLRKTLIEAALKVLQKVSPEQLSLRELAREAGVSAAAPYRHFKNKQELIAAIAQEGFELKFQYMAKKVKAAGGDPLKLYYACGFAYFEMGLKHPLHFRLMANCDSTSSEAFPSLMQSAIKSFLLLKETIVILQKTGIMGAGDPYHKAMNCWCLVHGFTSLFTEGRLSWLGTNAENAEAALYALLSQNLNGAKSALQGAELEFAPFRSAESILEKKALLESMHPEVEAVLREIQIKV